MKIDIKGCVKKLNAAIKDTGVNPYVIDFRETTIVEMQAHYNAKIVKKIRKMKYTFKLDDNGFLQFNKHGVEITFT